MLFHLTSKKIYNISKWLLFLISISAISFSVYAHPGRTDADGGHYDRSTGEYHYHHGYPAHQHPDGICPYDFDDRTGQSSGSSGGSSNSKTSNQTTDFVGGEERNYFLEHREAWKQEQREKGNTVNFDNQTGQSSSTNTGSSGSSGNSKTSNRTTGLNSAIQTSKDIRQRLNYTIGLSVSVGLILLWILYHLFESKRKLSSDLAALQRSYEQLQEECTSLKNTDWIDKLNQQEKEKNNLIQKNDELKTQVDALQQELKAVQRFSSSLQYEKVNLEQRSNSLESHVKSLRFDLAKAQETVQKALQASEQEKEYSTFLRSQLESLTTDALPFPKELLYKAGVPNGVTFDSQYLPHYYAKPSVEKNMRVYISASGKSYHRKFGCSGATIQTHLFIVANKYTPCERCIPPKAWDYKIPAWYYEFLNLLKENVEETPQIEEKSSRNIT